MFEFTESVHIQAPPNEVWGLLENVERWWPPSNPEHIAIEVRSPDKSINVGTEVIFEERVAGVKAQAEGAITRFVPETEAAWEGTAAYRYFGFRFLVREGVSWQLAKDGEASVLSARVWARFSPNIFGRALEWYARSMLNVVERDRAHARCELEYLKRTIEGNGFPGA
jgi:hypothetical protein